MRDYKKYLIWQRSMEFVKEVYRLSNDFPVEEKYGLTSQIRRAAVSIPSNIAEGAGRNSDTEFNRFLDISVGSLFEVETQLILASSFGYLANEDLVKLANEIDQLGKMVFGFKKKLKMQSK